VSTGIEQVTDVVAYHREGPVWSPSWGGAVISIERGFALEEPDGTVRPLDEVWSDPSVRMNEGGCDPDGRFYCGSMAYDQREGAALLYRVDPDGAVAAYAMGLGGDVSGAETQTADGVTSIRVAAGALPAAVIVAATAVMLAYPLTEKAFRRMVAEVAERRAADG
jgi:SMP-30/Gluconolactonase/LRE-like region